jgi:hypothetical protein
VSDRIYIEFAEIMVACGQMACVRAGFHANDDHADQGYSFSAVNWISN